ncbi:integral membrane protein GPR155 [Ixodes scapularis]|uniref:integral membrane protein GPR155 n=1 Tax=Ixodes scapularis TaxID=6945 RepID=UPI001C3874F8|nr:integral membrane protein GPR155 [Ixodes scapularis]
MWDASEAMAPLPKVGAGNVPCSAHADLPSFSWTLAKCFTIVTLGFLASRYGFVKGREVKGLDLFTSHVSLSALIFLNLSQIPLGSVQWDLVLGILLGKAVIFVLVLVIMVAAGRPGNLANAGLYAIFVTQVNDFGLAYPLVDSVYRSSRRPDYASYMYLVAPLSLGLFNPIGFFLVEVERVRSKMASVVLSGQKSHLVKQLAKAALVVSLRVCAHPHVWTSVLAIGVSSLMGRSKLPEPLVNALTVLADAFAAPILFLLGYYIAKSCRGSTLKGNLVQAIALASVKSILLPISLKLFTELMVRSKGVRSDEGSFSFLYGTVPTAPIVILYAAQRGLPTESLAAGVGLCTVLSIPLMFVAASVISLPSHNGVDTILQLKPALAIVSGLSLASSAYVVGLFCVTGRIYKFLTSVFFCLLVSEVVKAIGLLSWLVTSASSSWLYPTIFLLTVGQFASRAWTACLAVSIFLLKHYKSEDITKYTPLMFVLGYGIPVLLTAVVMISGRLLCRAPDAGNMEMPLFLNGDCETITAILLLSFCASVIAFASLQHAWEGLTKRPRGGGCSADATDFLDNVGNAKAGSSLQRVDGIAAPVRNQTTLSVRVRFQLSPSGVVTWPGEGKHDEESSTEDICGHTNATLLLLVLFVSMLIGILVCYWKLFIGAPRGVMKAVEYLDALTSFGQGIALFLACGLDEKLLSEAKTRILMMAHLRGTKAKKGNSLGAVDDPGGRTCEQFLKYHHATFEAFLEESETIPASMRGIPFHGHKMVDWLTDAGLVRSRPEAVMYGRHLLGGGVIAHEEDELHFYDAPYTYFLLPRSEK